MPRFLIEVPHDNEETECLRAIDSLLNFGSHFVMNAEWGCKDGVHKAWIIIEAENKEEARAILPPASRASATIVCINKFSMDEVDDLMKQHGMK